MLMTTVMRIKVTADFGAVIGYSLAMVSWILAVSRVIDFG